MHRQITKKIIESTSTPDTRELLLRDTELKGFEDKDFLDKGSDRLLDYIVAWGSQETIEKRIKEHVNAGASRIVFFPLDTGFGDATDSPTLKSMAPLITP